MAGPIRPTPSRRVLGAFDVADSEVKRFPGGQGNAWRCGTLVLKPLDMSIDALEWLHHSLRPHVPVGGLRVSLPHPARTGQLVVDGWTAFPYIEGSHPPEFNPNRWLDIINVGNIFSQLLRPLDRPSFMDARQDPWVLSDRIAWGDVSAELPDRLLEVPHVERLFKAMKPVSEDNAQIIHCDLSGNVLFHPTLPPAVIDLSLYWRPPLFASAIVVVDAICFYGGDMSLIELESGGGDETVFVQCLLRALVFRITTDYLRANIGQLGRDGDPYEAMVDTTLAFVERICEKDGGEAVNEL